MHCPNCKSEVTVKDTRYDYDRNETFRYRICKHCGNRFYTVEFDIENNEKFKEIWKNSGRLRQKGKGVKE